MAEWASANYDPVTGRTTFVVQGATLTPDAFVDMVLQPDDLEEARTWIIDNTSTTIIVLGDCEEMIGGNYKIEDYRFDETSVCDDQGLDALTGRTYDLRGVPFDRKVDTIDMGCYENQEDETP